MDDENLRLTATQFADKNCIRMEKPQFINGVTVVPFTREDGDEFFLLRYRSGVVEDSARLTEVTSKAGTVYGVLEETGEEVVLTQSGIKSETHEEED